MNNKENNDILENTGSDEASARAEKIRAIRESLRNAEVNSNVQAEKAPDVQTDDVIETQAEDVSDEQVQETPESQSEETADVQTVENPQSQIEENLQAQEAVTANAAAMGIQPKETANPAAETVQPMETANPTAETVQPNAEKLPKLVPLKKAANVNQDSEMPKKKKKGKKKKKKKTVKQRIRELFPEKGDSVAEIIRKFAFLISVIAIFVCGHMVADYYYDLWKSRKQNDSLSQLYEEEEPVYEAEIPEATVPGEKPTEKTYKILKGAKKLLEINSDTVGYIRVLSKDGSDPIIDLPVVRAYDNMKYLDRSFNGEESRAGTLFLDFRNHFDVITDGKRMYDNSEHLVIYGHNMADESMFGKLKYYYGSEEYYMEHPIIQLNSNYETYKYKIFAIFIVDAKDESETKYDCWNQLELDTEEEFYNLVNEAKRRTIYTNDVDVKYGDGLLSLSTCHYLLKDRSRLMIMARTIRPGEDEYEGTQNSKRNDNIKWPTMYYNSKKDEKYDEDAIFIPYGPEEAVKEAEAKLAAEKKKKEEEKKKKEERKKKEQASKEAEKSKNTTTTKKSDSKTTKKSTKTDSTKTTAVTKKTSAEE